MSTETRKGNREKQQERERGEGDSMNGKGKKKRSVFSILLVYRDSSEAAENLRKGTLERTEGVNREGYIVHPNTPEVYWH